MTEISCLTRLLLIFILLIASHLTAISGVSVYDVPPSIVVHPSTPNGDNRLPLVLECRATGSPQPTYNWTKDGVVIDVNINDRASLDGGNLVINPLQDEDNGVYQCFASNRLGTAISKKIATAVAYMDHFEDTIPSTFTVRVGEPLRLDCGANHGPPDAYPDPLLYWTDSSPMPSPIVYDARINQDQEGTLFFSNVIASDAKGYYCRAINNVVGVSQRSPKVTLIVETAFPSESSAKLVAHPPPNAVALRTEDYSMQCIATGYPTPEITWKRGEEQLQSGGRVSIDETGQRLAISAVENSDRGTYTCVATNDRGTDEFSSILNIESAPYFPAPPSDETKLPGESVSIECRAEGVPRPTVDVLVNGEPWAEFRSNIDTTRWTVVTGNSKLAAISIVDLQTTDSNVFQCIASNKYTEELTRVVLNVVSIPARITSLTPQTMTVFKNSSATFICHVEGIPPPDITWTFKGSVLTDGDKYSIDEEEGRLVITNVKGADSGVYECKASNDIYGLLEYSERDVAYLTVLDIDECSEDITLCVNGMCQNYNGSYTCTCDTGYQLNGDMNGCDDIDECSGDSTLCGNGMCQNNNGSYTCTCDTGYQLNGDMNGCDHIDECSGDSTLCANGMCQNNNGSYTCTCNTGYQLNGDMNGCDDVDECSGDSTLCANGMCQNNNGSYTCTCDTGYQLNGDMNGCDDNFSNFTEEVVTEYNKDYESTSITVDITASGKNDGYSTILLSIFIGSTVVLFLILLGVIWKHKSGNMRADSQIIHTYTQSIGRSPGAAVYHAYESVSMTSPTLALTSSQPQLTAEQHEYALKINTAENLYETIPLSDDAQNMGHLPTEDKDAFGYLLPNSPTNAEGQIREQQVCAMSRVNLDEDGYVVPDENN